MLYLIIIILSMFAIAAANLLLAFSFTPDSVGTAILSVSVATAAIFALDGLSALAIRRLTPEKWYSPDIKLFTVSKKERDFYRSIKIKSWKNKVPELGGFTSFHKDKLQSQSDPEYLARFIIEANYGVVIHIANAALGVLIAFIPTCASPSVWIPVFIVNLILSLLPVAILRYTSYTLQNLYTRCRKADAKKHEYDQPSLNCKEKGAASE